MGMVYHEIELATKWYCRAAEQGFAEAQYHLGDCYERGLGVPEDIMQAVKLYCLTKHTKIMESIVEEELAMPQEFNLSIPKEDFYNITQQVRQAISSSGVKKRHCLGFLPTHNSRHYYQ